MTRTIPITPVAANQGVTTALEGDGMVATLVVKPCWQPPSKQASRRCWTNTPKTTRATKQRGRTINRKACAPPLARCVWVCA